MVDDGNMFELATFTGSVYESSKIFSNACLNVYTTSNKLCFALEIWPPSQCGRESDIITGKPSHNQSNPPTFITKELQQYSINVLELTCLILSA